MNAHSLDIVLHRLLAATAAAAEYSKGDRVIINYGTARAPEYYPATVILLRTGMMYVLFDDQTKEKYRAVAGKVGLVGHAKTTRKRVTPIPLATLDKWVDLKTAKMVITPKEVVQPDVPKPPPPRVDLSLDYKQIVYFQDNKSNVWKITKVKIKYLDKDVYAISRQGPDDAEFYSVTTAPSLKDAITQIKQLLVARRARIVSHRVINN